MAIQKNFVIKNGLEVKSNLLIADATSNKVGIGTSVINYKLHVNGGIGATTIYVSSASTITTLSGSNLTYTTANIGVGIVTSLSGTNLNYSGISTVSSFYIGANQVISSGRELQNIASLDATTTSTIEAAIANAPNTFTDLIVTGISTLGVTSATNLTAQNLNVSGIGTIVNGFITNLTGTAATIGTVKISSGIITASSGIVTYFGDGSKLTGIATIGGGASLGFTTVTQLNVTGVTSLTSLTVSGIATFGNIVLNPVGIITASSGIVTYYGDGRYLQNILSGVGVATAGGVVGTGATILDFRGAGISTVTVASGIATINITGGGSGSVSISSVAPTSPANGNLWYSIEYGRTFIYYDEVALGIGYTAVWVDAAPFNQGGLFVSKYGDNMSAGLGVTIGSLSSPSVYFNGYTNSGFYSPAANQFGVVVSGTQRLNVNSGGIDVTGVATAIDFNSTSDFNLKTNIHTVENALETISSLRGVSFDWKETGKSSYGVIAQELQEVLPELVSNGEIKTVNYNGIIGVLIEAVKELEKEIEELKNS